MNEHLKDFFDGTNPDELFAKHYKKDPFSDIKPALLNSADIDKYIRATGIIAPYYPEKLKSASYEVLLEGDFYYWDEDRSEVCCKIKRGDIFTLPKNSIVYVHTSTYFRLPAYIALRFNLRINLVHKGLLVGTGPLIDPGFKGRLLVPIHNLTANEYKLEGGEGFFWVEFTKVSENTAWTSTSGYKEFDKKKIDRKPIDYFREANHNNPILSSIPDAINSAEKATKDAEVAIDEGNRLIRKFRLYAIWGSVGAIITVILALWALGYQVESIINDTNSYLHSAQKEFNILKSSEMREIESVRKEIISLKGQIQALENNQKANKKVDKHKINQNSLLNEQESRNKQMLPLKLNDNPAQ